jgi:hypothetical protein
LQFESDRSITQLSPFQFTWDYTDPFEEMVDWNQTFSGFRARFQDMVHSLFRKVRSHRESIARRAEELQKAGKSTMDLDWEDPLAAFKAAFRQLLAPKELVDVDVNKQTLEFRNGEGLEALPITSLSSGEREVVNIVFDFLLRNPEDCVVIFDEPELHLHPELSYKLLQTLKTVGSRNQFIFCTHSPDIVTGSLDQSVIFVAPPAVTRPNQAWRVSEDDETHEALKLLGQSVGIVSLGKRLVLIEGTSGSLDKQTYGSILRGRFPDLVLVPAGGKGLISSFAVLIDQVLDKSIWGIDFFMLCDRDAVPAVATANQLQTKSNGRLRVLPRYHLENFFLDGSVLSKVFEPFEPEASPLRDKNVIDAKLREIAKGLIPYATALTVSAHFRTAVGNVDLMGKPRPGLSVDELADAMRQKANDESKRASVALNPDAVAEMVGGVHGMLVRAVDSDTEEWKTIIPGKQVFNIFARHAQIQPGRLKQAYIVEGLKVGPSPFAPIIDIFNSFNAASSISGSSVD